MMNLNEIAVFVHVVQAGSFRRAAQVLAMPNSTVSTKVSQLEQRLGVQLLQRTTRKLRLTTAGESFFAHCASALDTLRTAEAEAATRQTEAQGTLRITAPTEMGESLLATIVRQYVERYPKVRVELLLTDRIVDLVTEGIDLALRAGKLPDSSMKARRLGTSRFAAFASPQYLARRGTPRHPRDLANHECLIFTTLFPDQWELVDGKQTVHVTARGSLSANDLPALRSFAALDHGIALLPVFLCYDDVKRGRLLRVLPSWSSRPAPMHLVYPAQRFPSPKLRDFLAIAEPALEKIFNDGAVS